MAPRTASTRPTGRARPACSHPSHRGYLEPQRLLASQGWITASISANGIVGQTQLDQAGLLDPTARASLVAIHLDRWAQWSSGAGRLTTPAVVHDLAEPDLGQTMLVGHSRGGEAVNRVAAVAADPLRPWRIHAQVLIGPVDGRPATPATGVPTVVLLPGCDGDTSDLQGQSYVDEARDRQARDDALRATVYIDGANHNYFNREWTPGTAADPVTAKDDAEATFAGDPACGTNGPNRLAPAEQRTVGAVYIAAAAQALVLRDQDVLPLLDGTPVRAASAGDARILTHALGGRRRALLVPLATTEVAGGGGTTATAVPRHPPQGCLRRLPHDRRCRLGPDGPLQALLGGNEPSRTALAVTWGQAGGTARARLSAPWSIPWPTRWRCGSSSLRWPPACASRPAWWTPRAGRSTRVPPPSTGCPPTPASAPAPPGPRRCASRSTGGRRPAAGVDLARVDRLELVPRSTGGKLWLLDAWTYRPGFDPVPDVLLPVYDVPAVTITEPGDRPGTYTLTVPIHGVLDQPATVWATVGDAPGPADHRAHRCPLVRIAVRVAADDIDKDPASYVIRTVPVRGISAIRSREYLTVNDDEPTPPVRYNDTASAAEGAALRWTFSRARPSGRVLWLQARFVAPAVGRELTAGDLTAEQHERLDYYSDDLDVPLSRTGLVLDIQYAPEEATMPLELALEPDGVTEGVEAVRLEIVVPTFNGRPIPVPYNPVPGVPVGSILTGTVTDTR